MVFKASSLPESGPIGTEPNHLKATNIEAGDKKQNPERDSHNPWKNPFALYSISIACAWIYLVIPCTNFWVYNLVLVNYFNICLPFLSIFLYF